MLASAEQQAVHPALVADYDHTADALYFSIGDARPSVGKNAGNGITVRYPLDDPQNAWGVVVFGFTRNGWARDLSKLAKLIANLLSADLGQVHFVLRPYRDRSTALAQPGD